MEQMTLEQLIDEAIKKAKDERNATTGFAAGSISRARTALALTLLEEAAHVLKDNR